MSGTTRTPLVTLNGYFPPLGKVSSTKKAVQPVAGLLTRPTHVFGPEGSSVGAELASRDGGVTLAVSDEGPGIAPELRERVFESYYRVPGSAAEGSGLGLAIVREIAAQHGATVEILDGESGRGTRVVVTFPASA